MRKQDAGIVMEVRMSEPTSGFDPNGTQESIRWRTTARGQLRKSLFVLLSVQYMHFAMAIWAQSYRICDCVLTSMRKPNYMMTFKVRLDRIAH